jgi:citrate synthase
MAKTADNLDLLNRAGDLKFSDLIFETLSEKTPTDQESKLFELILNLSIDHGPDAPSAMKVIGEAKNGETISEAVSEGIEQINDSHGGAAEPLMEILLSVKREAKSVKDLVEEYLKEGKRLPGFGHRLYKDEDPRAQMVLSLVDSEFKAVALEIETELEKQKGMKLPINIDGAIAVVLCSWGWDPKLGKAVFIVARTPGLCAHYLNNHS